MYAHQVIEDLRREKNKYCFDIESINEEISKSFKFNFGVLNFLPVNVNKGWEALLPLIKKYGNLPYSKAWFDADWGCKIGCLFYKKDDNLIDVLTFINKKVWIYFGGATYKLPFDESKPIMFFNGFKAEYLMEDKSQHCRVINNIIRLFLWCLILLNCKNVGLDRVDAPVKLNKKRFQKSKPLIFDYHTLAIDLTKSPKKSNGKTGTGPKKAVHFCRGHFREYTSDAPLMGKHVGLFWVGPHIRGTAKRVVSKDYAIKNPD